MWWMAAATVASAALQAGAKTAAAQPLLPNQQSNANDQVFDNSGWTVSTGNSTASAERVDSQGIQLGQWALIALAAVLVVGWVRSSR